MTLEFNQKYQCSTSNCSKLIYNPEKTGTLCNFCYRRKLDKEEYEATITVKIRQREKQLNKRFGLTNVEYEEIWKYQGFCCYICRKGNKNNKRFPVDHCHKTGKIRGILCNRCNQALGLLKDSIDSLKRAIEYLEKDQLGTLVNAVITARLGKDKENL